MLKNENTLYQLEEDDMLTHHGVALSSLDDLEDKSIWGWNDEDIITRKLHFGGGADQETIPIAAILH